FVTKAIEGAQISSVLIEPGKQAVINAKKRNLENIFCGTLTDLNGMAGQLTSIGAFDVIEHISADDTFIQEIYKMLKSGGYFFVTVPALQFLWSYEDAIAGHFKRYSRKRIVKLLHDHNFDVIYSSYYFSILLLPLFFIRVVPSKLGIRKKSKANINNEHKQRKGIIGKVLDFIWNWELGRIQQQKSIPFGTSCLIVAMKR
nr:methyltransferase domain-containing protein [Bacteroidota bacterium]